MKRLIPLLFLVGCGNPFDGMTNDEIIAETKKCEDAGLRAAMMMYPATGNVYIQCRPKPVQPTPDSTEGK